MNVDNILRVADAIEQHSIPDLGFNMGSWVDPNADPEDDLSGHSCGTTACIGGWAVAVFKGPFGLFKSKAENSVEEDAAKIFGIDDNRSAALMTDSFPRGATSAQAVRTLRHLAATGVVDWDLPEPAAA